MKKYLQKIKVKIMTGTSLTMMFLPSVNAYASSQNSYTSYVANYSEKEELDKKESSKALAESLIDKKGVSVINPDYLKTKKVEKGKPKNNTRSIIKYNTKDNKIDQETKKEIIEKAKKDTRVIERSESEPASILDELNIVSKTTGESLNYGESQGYSVLRIDDAEVVDSKVKDYEIEFFNFTSDGAKIYLDKENREDKIAIPKDSIIRLIGEDYYIENNISNEVYKVKLNVDKLSKTLINSKDEYKDQILTIINKGDYTTEDIIYVLDTEYFDLNTLSDDDLLRVINGETTITELKGLNTPDEEGGREYESMNNEDTDSDVCDENEMRINDFLDNLKYDQLSDAIIDYVEDLGYYLDDGYLIGYLEKDMIVSNGDFEEIDKNIYAINNSYVHILNDSLDAIDEIKVEESIPVVGENDQWYKVDLKDLFENYDELGVEDRYAIVNKSDFTDKPIFIEESAVLFAKNRANLYNSPDLDDISGYHVEKDGSIIQVERSLEWIKIKLDDGKELFAYYKDFDDVDSTGVNRYQRTYTVANESNKKSQTKTYTIRYPSNVSEDGVGNDIIEFAEQFVGGKYVWGGNSLTNGVDCSGFVREVYKVFGVNLPRHSSAQQRVGREVSLEEARPGDIVGYDGHVALYMGNGKIVHAANRRKGIIISNVYYGKKINTIRRIFD